MNDDNYIYATSLRFFSLSFSLGDGGPDVAKLRAALSNLPNSATIPAGVGVRVREFPSAHTTLALTGKAQNALQRRLLGVKASAAPVRPRYERRLKQ